MRIILGALAIFLVGTSIFYAARSGKRRVERIADSDSPITIPLAFIPFKVDGRDLGTLSRLQVLRSSPRQVEAVNFRVKLADSVGDEQLSQCILVAGDNGMNFNMKHINPNATFYCASASDTAGKNLAPMGSIETQRGNSYVLLSGADALRNFDMESDVNNAQADSIRAVYERMADSIQQVAESIGNAAEQRADSFRNAAENQADSIRAVAGMRADSIRSGTRGTSHSTPNPNLKPVKPKVQVKVN
jgi:ElaB/YqjD/DUF883 family membrane-anchored ribosome-binding protein